jgi:hypothetical protein
MASGSASVWRGRNWTAAASLAVALIAAAAVPADATSIGKAPAWSSVEVHSPHTTYFSPSAGLFAVTCTSTAKCLAGGSYVNSAGHEQAMVVSSSRTRWFGARTISLPHTSYAKFGEGLIAGLTCTSPGNCVAVGYLGTQQGLPGDGRGFIVTEVKGTWHKALVPAEPANASPKQYGELFSVACTGPGSCVAVGFYTNKALGYDGTIVTEVKGRWGKAVQVKLPSNAAVPARSLTNISSVQCPQAGQCVAVGRYKTKAGAIEALRVTQARGRWGRAAEVAAPHNAAASPDAGLATISCATRTTCVAIGPYATKSGASAAMTVTLSKGRWSAARGLSTVPSNAAANAQASLYLISCSPKTCQALGYYISAPGTRLWMVVSESGGHWGKAQQIPQPAKAAAGSPGPVYPYGVSCTSAGWCSAVGTYETVGGSVQSMAATRG